MKIHFLVTVALIGLLASACGSSPTPRSSLTQAVTPGVSVEVIAGPDTHREVVQKDNVVLNNCDSSGEMEVSIERSRTIRHEVALEASCELSVQGEAKIMGTGVKIGAAVAAKHGTVYGMEEIIKKSVIFRVKGGTNNRYDLQLVEIWQLGQLRVRVDGQSETIPYRFRQGFALEVIGSQDLGCPSEVVRGGGAPEASTQTPREPSIAPSPETPISEATSDRPWFGPISFCVQIDPQNRCIDPVYRLPAGTTKFHVSWAFENIPNGARFERLWYYNGNRLKYVDDRWDSAWGSPTGIEYTWYHYEPGFASGEYRVELYINGELLQAGSVYIGP